MTLPSLWILLRKILRSGLSDVWAPCVAKLLCCLTLYLWPCEARKVERIWLVEALILFTASAVFSYGASQLSLVRKGTG